VNSLEQTRKRSAGPKPERVLAKLEHEAVGGGTMMFAGFRRMLSMLFVRPSPDDKKGVFNEACGAALRNRRVRSCVGGVAGDRASRAGDQQGRR
jgi:hypothetical protein